MCEAAQGPTVPDVGERGPVQAGAWRRREKIAVLQCIKYEESLLSLLLSPHIPMPEKGTHFLSGSGERQAQSWAHCRQGKQQGGVALPKFFLQAWHACEAQAPLGLSSHTHLIVIAGLGNKVLFNSESIWQAGRAGSVGCQPCQLPRADPVWLQRSGRGPCHSTSCLGTQLPHAVSACTRLLCQQSPWVGVKGWCFFSLVALRAFLRLEWHFLSLG